MRDGGGGHGQLVGGVDVECGHGGQQGEQLFHDGTFSLF